MTHRLAFTWTAVLASILAHVPCGEAAQALRVALIEMQSGPFAATGIWQTNHFDMAMDEVNARGGLPGDVKVEVVRFDSKNNPQEALLALKQATDQGIRYVFHGLGSHIAHALVDGINKHNAREPGREVIYLNYSALDPALTNDKCSFYHFRFAPNADMQISAMLRHMTPQSHLRKLYLINQDYAYGQGVRKVLRETLAKARPDVQIVGDDLHPLGKVKDFAPYISKVRAVDADSVFTSNWGSDLNLLVKSAEESGLPSSLLTLNASVIGFPTAIGTAGANRLWTVAPWHANAGGPLESYNLRYKARFGEDFSWVPAKSAVEMWAKALIAAKSTDPIKVGRALEGMRHDAGAGEVLMRAEDHQLQQPQFIAVWTKAGRDGVPQDLEGTGYGFKTVARLDQRDSALPTTCKMVRPQ